MGASERHSIGRSTQRRGGRCRSSRSGWRTSAWLAWRREPPWRPSRPPGRGASGGGGESARVGLRGPGCVPGVRARSAEARGRSGPSVESSAGRFPFLSGGAGRTRPSMPSRSRCMGQGVPRPRATSGEGKRHLAEKKGTGTQGNCSAIKKKLQASFKKKLGDASGRELEKQCEKS